jgi:uncharacterized protein YbjT (DUF2867 family)
MKAIVVGSTGLVGKELIQLLLESEHFSEVTSISRRKLTFEHKKLTQVMVEFDQLENWSPHFKGDVLFLCLGTTKKIAGSKENQWKVDFDFQFRAATLAVNNGVNRCVLISSIGANSSSPFFYLKMKGALENALKSLNFKQLSILRPGPLVGRREKPRFGESLLILSSYLLPKKIFPSSPVEAKKVASFALECSIKDDAARFMIHENHEITDVT